MDLMKKKINMDPRFGDSVERMNEHNQKDHEKLMEDYR